MKRAIILLLMLLFATLIFAAPVSSETACLVARNFVFERLGTAWTISTSRPLESESNTSFIQLINLKPRGFVLIATDDAAYPVLGYSTDNNWGELEIPIQLQELLKNWNAQLKDIRSRNLSPSPETQSMWQRLNRDILSFVPDRNYRDVSPLLTTIWGQGTYYNALCPSGTPVGCVATAMAQIMRYWSFPTTGVGSHSYSCPPYGTLSADFAATTYNWAAMPNNVTSSNTAVATIGYHAGVAVEMGYAPDGSGAYSTDVAPALINYFRYSSTAQYKDKSSYSATVWEAMMKGEIDNSRPVYYSGSSTQSGGHAFVLDGYQGSNFHINWGWNGSYNGYFALTALNPGGENFSSGQAAVIGIKPTITSLTINEGFEGTTFPPSGWSTNGTTTFSRSTTSPITGTASAYYSSSSSISGVRLITPKLATHSSSAPITFKAKRGSSDRLERLTVAYSANGTSWTNLSTFTPTNTAQTFTQATTGITAGNYYFAIVPSSTNTNQTKAFWVDEVTGPELATVPSLNISSWNAGALSPGDQARSENIFTLSNVGGGTLTINSITNLSATEFSTNFNTSVSLVYGQTHDFGFSYDPINYGTDNVSFVINTNAGNLTIALSGSATYAVLYDSFENYADFSLTLSPWTQYDGDLLPTYGMQGYSWTNSGYTGAWMAFNPSTTSPSLQASYPAYNGVKYATCWAGVPGTVTANNDWLISPQFTMSAAGTVSFYAKAFSGTYAERMKVMYSTTTNATSAFTNYLAGSGTSYVTVSSTTWTQYSYAIPITAKYIAIQCVSADAWALCVDEFKISDGTTPPTPTFGNLNGYVYKSGTTEPISNALVSVGTKQAYTNSSGFYQINYILTGSVSAMASAPGMFYHSASVSGILISNGTTTNQNFYLTWGELTANPASVTANLYQGETGNANIVLANPGGTANTLYAGYFVAATRNNAASALFASDRRKPAPDKYGTRIPPITDPAPIDRYTGWFSYGSIDVANYYTGAQTERGNYFLLSDFALMDGAVTVSQLRSYFYNPSAAAWTTTTHRQFTWKVYSVAPDGTIALLHTSATITLPSIATGTYTLSEYTLPAAVTIPAGYDFIVTVKPASATDTSGRPQSLATDASTDNGVSYDATNGWAFMGMDTILDAYVNGTEWLSSYNFSGSIVPGGTANLPINFNTVGVSAGTKNAYIYIYNDANYTAPSGGNRGDMMAIPISLTVTVATNPVAVLTTQTSWTTNANAGSPSTSGDIFTLKNVGPGNLTITSISGLSGTPFTTNFNTGISLAQNATYSFGFTFTPTVTGIWQTTFSIVTNGGTKTITLKGYGNYLYESFEGAVFPPDGWQAVDNDADTYNWYQYSATDAPHSGTYCAGSASWVPDSRTSDRRSESSSRLALTPDNWLITPRLAIPTSGLMNFWISAQDPSWPAENYSVKISTTTNAIASFTTTLLAETLADGDWHFKEIDLSAYAGQSVFIAFQHHGCTDQFILKLDDIYLPPLAAPLVYGNITGRVGKAGTSEYIEGAVVTVAGRTFTTLADGNYTFSNIVCDTYPLTVTATGYSDYAASVTIPENSTLTHNVMMNYAQFYTSNTIFNLSVETGNSTTANLSLQNTGTVSVDWTSDSGIWGGDILLSSPLNEDFEDYDINGWTGSVGPNSAIYGSASQPYGYNSDAVWVFASYGTSEAQYLITPKLSVSAGSSLSFWYKQFNPSSESFEVRISTTDAAFASFTQTLATLGPLSDTAYANFNQSLSAYAGQEIYVMFYYPRVDNYQYGYVMIDNVSGPSTIMAPTEWLGTNPVAGTLAAGGSSPVTLNINAAALPIGTYTAQTWFFGDAVNEPYKLYVTLNVTAPLSVDPPQNPVIEAYPDGVALAWDPVGGANSYKVYGCNTPEGTYTFIQSTEENGLVLSNATLATHGLSALAFFKVTADTSVRNAFTPRMLGRNPSTLLPVQMRKQDQERVLNKL
jgi:hypothetical protein